MYEHLPRVTGLNDDVLVTGTTRDEYLQTLRATFQRARENSQRYNIDKCRFKLSEVSYYGHVISSDGMKSDLKKVEAIAKMAKPANKTELQTILSMANYLAKFAPHMSDLTAPMRDLLKKDSEFVWDVQQETAFTNMKGMLSASPVLAFFDPKKELSLQVDASGKVSHSCRRADR